VAALSRALSVLVPSSPSFPCHVLVSSPCRAFGSCVRLCCRHHCLRPLCIRPLALVLGRGRPPSLAPPEGSSLPSSARRCRSCPRCRPSRRARPRCRLAVIPAAVVPLPRCCLRPVLVLVVVAPSPFRAQSPLLSWGRRPSSVAPCHTSSGGPDGRWMQWGGRGVVLSCRSVVLSW